MAKKKLFTPYSTLGTMLGKLPAWWPEEEQQRIAAYEKYDQMYWNDPTQYAIRVLEDETPVYIPNAQVIVDTTAHYLLKGLDIVAPKQDKEFWDAFVKRERFYSKFHQNKTAGIARGDWAFHVTADPTKPEGERVSIDTLHPGMVWKVEDPDNPDDLVRIHIVTQFTKKVDGEDKLLIRKLTYEKVLEGSMTQPKRVIYREEALFEITPDWFGPTPKLVQQILPREALDERIQHFPVYWYNNREWESQARYGSSELRGLEFLEWAVSQGATDTQAALALEGLGVFATDGGRPVNDDGIEEDWEVAPGKVMEVPAGAYFRRVDGVGTITPMMDQIKYLEGKMQQASGLSDVALGQVDVQTAASGIALAIRFMPTLAKIEHRDTAGIEITQQMVHDLQAWFDVYEGYKFHGEFEVNIAKVKLPADPVRTLNELNNMVDRKIISRKTYAKEAAALGYNIDFEEELKQIQKEAEEAAKQAALTAPAGLQQNAQDAAAGLKPITSADGSNTDNVDNSGNQSNNRSRPNESSGTEAGSTSK
jgi:hypothetical protein